jgi:hypothetical protein
MPVVSKNLDQPFLAHGLHGNAIGQAIAFIGTLCIEIEAGQKRRAALRDDPNYGICQNALNARGDLDVFD